MKISEIFSTGCGYDGRYHGGNHYDGDRSGRGERRERRERGERGGLLGIEVSLGE